MNIFVIMPFHSEFDPVYQQLIKKPLEEKNHVVNRADDVSSHQSILKTIIHNISNSDVIIADLTAQNANVYYELGIAHTLDKPTIHIVQSFDDLGFDIISYNAIKYSIHFDESPELTNKILDIIERAEQGNYNFSNPVSDSIGDSLEQHKASPTKETLNSDEAVSQRDEEAVEDEAEPGILDSMIEAEESVTEIGKTVAELGNLFFVLSEKTQRNTERSNELNAQPEQKGFNSRRLQIAKQFASDLNTFSDAVTKRIPRLNESWNMLDQSIGYVLSVTDIQEESEIEAVRTGFINSSQELRRGIKGNLEAFESFQEILRSLPKLSKATNRAIGHADNTFNKLNDELRLGDSVLTRIINLAQDMIDRYYAENGGVPTS